MFPQLTSRIFNFNRTRDILDVNLDSIVAPPIPSIDERDEFSIVDPLNVEPTPGPSRDVDAFGVDPVDIPSEFPKLHLPTDGEATTELQGVLNVSDIGASTDTSRLFFIRENFNFPAYPTDLELTAFSPRSSMNEGSLFRETLPMRDHGIAVCPPLVSENDFILQSHLGTHLDDLANSPELLINMPQLSPDRIESYPSSVFTTPGPATPISSIPSSSLSPIEKQPPSSTLWDPQPCLAVSTLSDVFTTRQEPILKEDDRTPVRQVCDSIQRASTSSTSDLGSCSLPSTLPNDFFKSKPSSTGAIRSSHKKAKTAAPRTSKVRHSPTSSDKNKHLPCTYEGCTETFYDNRVLRRHLQNIHQDRFRWYCPGTCRKSYTREDALTRHLNSMDEDSSCQTAARALGWDPVEKCSVRKLRTVSPPA